MFQSTHPHGVRLRIWYIISPILRFNPRTHTGCDDFKSGRKGFYEVSIHAPTRGATKSNSANAFLNLLFQSTHPHGVRPTVRNFIRGDVESFNPRTHTGCDPIQQIMPILFFLFQSTHPHGVRPCLTGDFLTQFLFQSTHPHGVRPCSQFVPPKKQGFNPRTHTGCDATPNGTPSIRCCVSIHAPTRGATLTINNMDKLFTWVSIHAPTRGATQPQTARRQFVVVFQSTHPHGVRH